MERYITAYPQFWTWTQELLNRAKAEITDAGLCELLVDSLKRGRTREHLRESPPNTFFDSYFDLIENGKAQMQVQKPLEVPAKLADVIRELHELWHEQLLGDSKLPGWGAEFDKRSHELLALAGTILGEDEGITQEVYRFGIAYGRLSMSLPYIAYHTIDAIIMTYGVLV